MTLLLILPLLTVVAAHGVLRVRAERAEIIADTERQMGLAAQAMQITLESALRQRDPTDVYRLLFAMTSAEDPIDRVRVFNASLRPAAVSGGGPPIDDWVPTGALRRVLETGRATTLRHHEDGVLVLYHLLPVQGPTGRIDAAIEVVHVGQELERRTRAAVLAVAGEMTLLFAVLVSVALLALQREVFGPVWRLAEGIRRLAAGATPARLVVRRRDELGRVAEAFNAMTEQLEAARRRLLEETERALDLEQQLRHAQTLAVAGRLASGLAHEIGTPLNIISGRAEYVLQKMAPDDARRAELRAIITQIDRISLVIRSLLDVVRPRRPEKAAVAVAGVLERCWPLVEHAARRRGVRLLVGLPPDLPPCLADAGQLQQVLLNLLLNAFAASRAGDTVRVRGERRGRDGEDGVEIRVEDEGAGIPPELLPCVCEPFVTTKPAGQGTGLGLAISRDIVRDHGGTLGIDSRQGAGTTVTVWLPAAPVTPAREAA
ncbi:MAG TPA: HAMP domain-containing sensor histidine kinase [Candidatus Tectomicrobia bacterium]|nr:HAMP domain-containing sensor histidine kinase [Candidatus Tectomicrobia bacterium]